jgi:hypothetical protein
MVNKGKQRYKGFPGKKYEVENFSYNGFMGQRLPGKALYKAKFIRWTSDPGVGAFICSDGKERLIPTFALVGDHSGLPEQDFRHKVFFGSPSHS